MNRINKYALVAELADAPDSKSGSFGSVGSSPTRSTHGQSNRSQLWTGGYQTRAGEKPYAEVESL